VFRRSFYRPSRLTELPFSPLYLVASVCVLGRFDLAAAVRLSGRPVQPSTVVAVHPRRRRPARPALAAGGRAAGDGVPDLAAAHRAPGDSPADPDELERATKS
jgi:hypothetical protein